MADPKGASAPRQEFQFVDNQTGKLTSYGLAFLEGLWRQGAASGFAVTPCTFAMATNVITLVPKLNEEAANSYGDGMTYWAVADATSTGLVTGKVSKRNSATPLATVKVLKSDGSAQATTGDIVSGKGYLFVFDSTLDGGAGAFVLK